MYDGITVREKIRKKFISNLNRYSSDLTEKTDVEVKMIGSVVAEAAQKL